MSHHQPIQAGQAPCRPNPGGSASRKPAGHRRGASERQADTCSIQATVLELIAELATTFATTVVLVSHALAAVRTICRRAVVMRAGRICEDRPTGELFMAPRHPYTRELIAAIPSLPA